MDAQADTTLHKRCQQCAHLQTVRSHGHTENTCQRRETLSGTCGWWRPRRLSIYELQEQK